MGTRCVIAELTETGKVVGSYCHYDGYIGHTGSTLMECYNTPELASQIANIGYASFLEKNYDSTVAGSTHKNQPTMEFENIVEFLKEGGDSGAEYLYLWDGDAWFVSHLYSEDHRFEALENFTA
jgi:hypothetical protein